MNLGKNLAGIEEYKPFLYKDGMIRLDANECYADMPDEIKQKAVAVLREEVFNRYPDPFARELCAAFSALYGLDSENVVAGNGSDELIALMLSALLPSGSRLLVLSPDFSVYKIYAGFYGHRVFELEKDAELQFSSDSVIDAAKRFSADMIVFSNPCNPTGQGIRAADVEKIVSSVDAAVCVDEAYMEFWSDNETVLPLVNRYENLIVLKTCSKAFGLAAFRLGFAVCCKKLAACFKKAKIPYNINALSQAAGLVVLKNKEYLKNNTAQIITRKQSLYELLKPLSSPEYRVFDTKTNFVLLRTSYAKSIYEKLRAANIIVRYLPPDLLRITAGTRGENETLKNKLEAILA